MFKFPSLTLTIKPILIFAWTLVIRVSETHRALTAAAHSYVTEATLSFLQADSHSRRDVDVTGGQVIGGKGHPNSQSVKGVKKRWD